MASVLWKLNTYIRMQLALPNEFSGYRSLRTRNAKISCSLCTKTPIPDLAVPGITMQAPGSIFWMFVAFPITAFFSSWYVLLRTK